MHFLTKNSYKINMNMCYENKQIINTYSTKLLALFNVSSLSWNDHIDQLVFKLITAYYGIRSGKPLITQETLRMIYFFLCSLHINLWYNFLR